jgi:GntR family transcriptional regulator/MocR family aminotransferase
VSTKSEPVDLALAVERRRGEPLYEQLQRRLREQIRSGRLPAHTKLPSTRALAAELRISRGVVLEAYGQLVAEGYLLASQGAPTRVAPTASAERPPVLAGSLEQRQPYDFDPAVPDLSAFPRERWLRSARSAMRAARFDAFGIGDPRGSPGLRNQLMTYLTRVRGAAPEPEHTIVCGGFGQGFSLLCRCLRDRGVDRIAVEQPGWPGHRLIAQAAGLEPVPVAVDERGIDVASLVASGCETAVVTPSHQFPLGGVLDSERRAALLEWAEDHDALVVEDDYDSELRYDRGAVGALQGLAPERVCQIGSLSKRLAPGLRLGWMLSPSWLTGALTYEKGIADGGSPMLDQLTLAEFLARGELDVHMRRMRLRYRARRQALLAGLERLIPEARVVGVPAGTFALVELPASVDERALISAAAAGGVGVDGLGAERAALVLGVANLSQAGLARGLELLARALQQAGRH